MKGYKIFCINTGDIVVSRNVHFYENIFPSTNNDSCNRDDHEPENLVRENEGVADNDNASSKRKHMQPTYLKDYHCNIAEKGNIQEIDKGKKYPLSIVINYSNLSNAHKSYSLAISMDTEPKTYSSASKNKQWIEAMDNEIDALNKNETWYIVSLPKNKVHIGCKWIYKIKRKTDGTVERFKARLVAKGYTQQNGIDYLETFSPVAKITTIRMLLALVAKKGWFLEQLDINNAFLHGSLDEEIYMDLPQGINSNVPNAVCKLKKSLYGLKQASRQWNSTLTTSLITKG